MLQFIKDNMATVDGVAIYPIISLVIFVAFFTGVLWWTFRTDKNRIKEISQLPLNED